MAKQVKKLIIENISQQEVPVQYRAVNGDFFITERQVRISPGKSYTIAQDLVNVSQIDNLKKLSLIRVTSKVESEGGSSSSSELSSGY